MYTMSNITKIRSCNGCGQKFETWELNFKGKTALCDACDNPRDIIW